MLFTFLREAPGRVERRLFPGLRGADGALPVDATDADIALSVWQSLRPNAMRFGEGPSERRVLPGRVNVSLPHGAFDAYAEKRLMEDLEASVESRVMGSAGAEGFAFAESPLRISFARASEEANSLEVQFSWPPAPATSRQDRPSADRKVAEAVASERTYLAFAKSALRADLFALDVIRADRSPVVRHFLSLGARNVGFNRTGHPVASGPAFRLALSARSSETPGWEGVAPEWGATEWRETFLDASAAAKAGRGLEGLLDAEHRSWSTGDETERLTMTDDVAMVVGRSETTNDIAVPGDLAITSIGHLLLTRELDGGLAAVDAGSSNGTLLNGHPLTAFEPRNLQDGDVLTVGTTLFRVALAG